MPSENIEVTLWTRFTTVVETLLSFDGLYGRGVHVM
jgi:hypothetical protein